jgi:hypothetical protein
MLAPSQADSPSTQRWKGGAENVGNVVIGVRNRQRDTVSRKQGMLRAVLLANIARSSPIGE